MAVVFTGLCYLFPGMESSVYGQLEEWGYGFIQGLERSLPSFYPHHLQNPKEAETTHQNSELVGLVLQKGVDS